MKQRSKKHRIVQLNSTRYSTMMKNLIHANILIVNPTHYAIALQYNPRKDKAPIVIAKGVNVIALEMIALAKEHGIYIIQNPPLARSLYIENEIIGSCIPNILNNIIADMYAVFFHHDKLAYNEEESNSIHELTYDKSWHIMIEDPFRTYPPIDAPFSEYLKYALKYFENFNPTLVTNISKGPL